MKNCLLPGCYIFILSFFLSCTQLPPRDLTANPILDCTGGPHCVTTRTLNTDRKIEPISFNVNTETFKDRALRAIQSMTHSNVVRAEKNYVYAEFRSALFGFVDDFEVYFDTANERIDLRSSSGIGYSDLGVNKSRAEKFKELF